MCKITCSIFHYLTYKICPAQCGSVAWNLVPWTKAARVFYVFFCFYPPPRIFFSLLLEREEEKERHRCDREALIGHLPYTPGLRIVHTRDQTALTGNRTHSLLVMGQHSNILSHMSQSRRITGLILVDSQLFPGESPVTNVSLTH